MFGNEVGALERPDLRARKGAHAVARLRFRLLTVAEPQESAGDSVRFSSVWKKLLGHQRAVVEDVWLEEGQLVVAVRPVARWPVSGVAARGADVCARAMT